jgi:Nuclease-related domain/GLTT repeat (6 copies)
MAWPKLRNKSSRSVMAGRNRSGATHDGARSQGEAAEGVPAGPDRGPDRAPPDAPADASGPAAWPEAGATGTSGTAELTEAELSENGLPEHGLAEAGLPEVGLPEAGLAGDQPGGGSPAEAELAGAGLAETEGAADSADLPLWDWSPPGAGSGQEEAAAGTADPPKAEWKLVVTPVGETAGEPRRPGIGERPGNLSHLAANPRMRVWRWRLIVAALVMVAFSVWISWKLGLTLAVVVIIADTIYRSRRSYPGVVKLTAAQRRTRRQLGKLARAGYRAMHARPIPESEEQIDHLVVGPTGVFAIDSEHWDKRMPVRTRKGTQLWHGPVSKKDRLQHAQWEAQRAAEMLSGEIGQPVSVRPVMAVYGPRIPWDVATIRDVDVFSGPRLRKYLRRRARQADVRPLSDSEIEKIYEAANKAFPHLSSVPR